MLSKVNCRNIKHVIINCHYIQLLRGRRLTITIFFNVSYVMKLCYPFSGNDWSR